MTATTFMLVFIFGTALRNDTNKTIHVSSEYLIFRSTMDWPEQNYESPRETRVKF